MTPSWISAFLDFAARDFERGVVFWAEVTGYDVSSPRGDDEEFATLVPRVGDDYLRVQQLRSGRSRLHLDLHVTDPRAAADRAVELGAVEVAAPDEQGYVVVTSPAGLTLCFVSHPAARRPPAATWRGGGRSAVDQVCLDIAPSVFERECAFWEQITGWTSEPARLPQFRRLHGPETFALRFLLQRTDTEGPVGAHLDLAASDRAAEVARHEKLGATVERVEEFWTVLRDPAGSRYCVTHRDPHDGART
ncbi:MAG: VOC family protein [Nocardioides sp.]